MYNRDWVFEWNKRKLKDKIIGEIKCMPIYIYEVFRFYYIALIGFCIGYYLIWTALPIDNYFMILVAVFIIIISGQCSIKQNLGYMM